jgi:hypothetical protein
MRTNDWIYRRQLIPTRAGGPPFGREHTVKSLLWERSRVPYPFALGAKGWVRTLFPQAAGGRIFICSTRQSLIRTRPTSPKA